MVFDFLNVSKHEENAMFEAGFELFIQMYELRKNGERIM
jgi:hypothetical protein